MSNSTCFCGSTIGKKVQMAVTGLLLIGFLTGHLLGNLLLFANDGGTAFNDYAHALTSNPLIYVAELGLLVLFLVHMVSAIKLTSISKAARPDSYENQGSNGKKTFASRTMLQTGILIFLFVILHLITFKWGPFYAVGVESTDADVIAKAVEAGAKRDLYRTVTEWFDVAWYSLFYVATMLLMGLHLSHGFKSAFQTLGLRHKKYTPKVELASALIGWGYGVAFAIFPLYFLIIK